MITLNKKVYKHSPYYHNVINTTNNIKEILGCGDIWWEQLRGLKIKTLEMPLPKQKPFAFLMGLMHCLEFLTKWSFSWLGMSSFYIHIFVPFTRYWGLSWSSSPWWNLMVWQTLVFTRYFVLLLTIEHCQGTLGELLNFIKRNINWVTIIACEDVPRGWKPSIMYFEGVLLFDVAIVRPKGYLLYLFDESLQSQ